MSLCDLVRNACLHLDMADIPARPGHLTAVQVCRCQGQWLEWQWACCSFLMASIAS